MATLSFFNKVSIQDRIYFYQMLSMMLDAGMSLNQSLEVVQKKISNPTFQELIVGILHQVKKGDSLARSMEKFPQYFQETEYTIIRSGEQTGHLQDTLEALSGSLESTQEVMNKVKSAMVYPITVFIALLVASGFILTTVIPQLIEIYENSGATPPPSLGTLAAMGAYINAHPFTVTLAFVTVVGGGFLFMKSSRGRLFRQRMYMQTPYIKTIYQRTILSRILRTLGMLMESGVGLAKSLQLLGKVANNDSYTRALLNTRSQVEQGIKLSAALADQNDLFPADICQLISVGEQTAELGTISKKIAKQLDKETEYELRNLTNYLEPLVIVVIGLVVGWFAFVMLGSIFSLTDIVS